MEEWDPETLPNSGVYRYRHVVHSGSSTTAVRKTKEKTEEANGDLDPRLAHANVYVVCLPFRPRTVRTQEQTSYNLNI